MRGFGLVTALAAAGAVLLGASPAGASGWTVVPSPPSDGGFFNAVSARTDADAWAVGDLSATTPLTAQWNGTSWSQVPGPTVPGATNTGGQAGARPACSGTLPTEHDIVVIPWSA